MQNYDFGRVTPRRHTNSYKWDTPSSEGVLPLWVADMDFTAAPCIIEALRKRVEHGIFGYTKVPEEYYMAVISWFHRRYSWRIDPSHIIYTTGVVPALSAVIKALTNPGDSIIVQTPAYNCFFSSIRNNGCLLADNELIYGEEGRYTIDFEDLELKASHPATTLMILCNPHNPAGRVWTTDELVRISEICKRHGVTVVSDEIHCDLTFDGRRYTPYAPIAEQVGTKWVVCNAASKSFNIAGLQIANIICADAEMRQRIDKAININEVCDVNPFGVVGLMAAYNQGEDWLEALLRYLWNNYRIAREYLTRHLPGIICTPLEGTYLLWLNCRAIGLDSDRLVEILEQEGKVLLSPGTIYGKGGEGFLRLNLACPETLLREGLQRIVDTLSKLLPKE